MNVPRSVTLRLFCCIRSLFFSVRRGCWPVISLPHACAVNPLSADYCVLGAIFHWEGLNLPSPLFHPSSIPPFPHLVHA